MERRDLIFATGYPGTAKTLLALYKAFELLDDDNSSINKIYYAKPKVCIAGEQNLGALPGTLEEKTMPYLNAVRNNLEKFMSPGRIELLMKARGKEDSQFEFLPFDFLRGMTYDDAFIIVDEAQNMTAHTAYTVASRIGERSKMVFTGDGNQRDLNKKHGTSGLQDALQRLGHMDFVGHINFEYDDITRSKRAKQIIGAYRDLYGY